MFSDQLLRATQHPFLARAAKGTLSKELIAQWLAEDEMYLEGLRNLTYNLLNQVRSQNRPNSGSSALSSSSTASTVESRLVDWLKGALEGENTEADFFKKTAENYKLDVKNTPLKQDVTSSGLRQFRKLFSDITNEEPNPFLPWLEGIVVIWATEKVYYEAWSWARRQDKQPSPRTFDNDLDGGAMRKEFIPNWSSRDMLHFVEQIERILNEAVSQAVNKDDARWKEVKTRTDAVYRAVLDAEEAFWPDVSEEKEEEQQHTEGFMDNTMREMNAVV